MEVKARKIVLEHTRGPGKASKSTSVTQKSLTSCDFKTIMLTSMLLFY